MRSIQSFILLALGLLASVGVFAAPGDLDTTFGSGVGWVSTSLNRVARNDYSQAAGLQSDGKLVVVGYAYNGSNDDMIVTRYNSDGSLDTTFDGDGKVITKLSTNPYSEDARAVLQQSSGKLIVLVTIYSGGSSDFALVRYNTDGSLDQTFGTNGLVKTSINPEDVARSLIQQSDGKLVVAGYTKGANYDYALLRYNSDGTLDNTFSSDGLLVTAFGTGNDYAISVVQQADGKLVAAGYSRISTTDDFSMARYNADGTLDTTFSGDGKQTTNISGNDSAYSVIQQLDGKLVLLGKSAGSVNATVARYNTNGVLDPTFDSDGYLVVSGAVESDPNNIIQQADGKLVFSGSYYNGSDYDMSLFRINSNGTLDTTFDSDGRVQLDLGATNDYGISVVAGQGDKLYLVGQTQNNTMDFTLARYDSVGLLDVSYSGDGSLVTDIGYSAIGSSSVVQQLDEKIVVALNSSSLNSTDLVLIRYTTGGAIDTTFGVNGFSPFVASVSLCDKSIFMIKQSDHKFVVGGGSAGKFVITRFDNNGMLDTSFDGDGQVVLSVGSYGYACSLVQQSDGKLVIVGESDSDFALVRLNENGSLDTTFGADGIVTTDFGSGSGGDYAKSVIIQPNGKLIVAGETNATGDNCVAIARYNSDGSLDSSFGSNGVVIGNVLISFGGSSIGLQQDGKLLVGGSALIFADAFVSRYNTDGSLDNSFGLNGSVTTNFGDNYEGFSSLLLLPDGKMVAAGYTAGVSSDHILARYNIDGTLDSGFGVGGTKIVGISSQEGTYSLIQQSDGKLLTTGFGAFDDNLRLILLRYEAYGDNDNDGINDYLDTDDDNDSVLDINDAFPLNPAEWLDTDGDTIGNNADWDDDGDGVPDVVDAAPLDNANTSEIVLPLNGIYKGNVLQNMLMAH